ncbi:hypothetical protein KI387_041267, partial [Taxus chinensis]
GWLRQIHQLFPPPGFYWTTPSHSSVMYPSTDSLSIGKLEVEIDGLFANTGYTVRASRLAHVAQRQEQLESVMGAVQDPGISHLAFESVHYNPSDIAGWVMSMLGELNPNSAVLGAVAVFCQGLPIPAPAYGLH